MDRWLIRFPSRIQIVMMNISNTEYCYFSGFDRQLSDRSFNISLQPHLHYRIPISNQQLRMWKFKQSIIKLAPIDTRFFVSIQKNLLTHFQINCL